MSDKTTSANDKKIDKEKTVKKRAARSIVAPRIEEEGNHSVTSKKDNSYIPGTPKPSKPVKKTVTVASPAPVHTEPGKARTPKVISAPVGVLNEDNITVAAKKNKTVTMATGWPDRPPKPRVPEKNIKPETKTPVIPQDLIRPQMTNSKPSLLDALANSISTDISDPIQTVQPVQPAQPAQPAQDKEVEQKLDESLKKVQESPAEVKKAEVKEPEGSVSRKIVKTVVTTTTTTTYEPVTEEEYRKITEQVQADNNTQTTVVREVYPQGAQLPQRSQNRQNAQVQPRPSQGLQPRPVAAQPAMRQPQPGRVPEPVINKAAVQEGTTPGKPVGGAVQQQPRPGQPPRPAVKQPPKTVQQPGTATVPQPVQPAQASAQVKQPPSQPSSIIGTMEGSAAPKPMTAMDRQLKEIEKALGLSPDTQQQNNMANSTGADPQAQTPNSQNPAVNPVPTVVPANMNTKPVMDSQTKKTMEYMMLGIEALIFVVILCVCISIYQKIKNRDYAGGPDDSTYEENYDESYDPSDDVGTESFDVEQAGAGDELTTNNEFDDSDMLADNSEGEGSYASSDSVDVENDNFSLRCTNVTVTLDSGGNPAALIYFTFTNKTGNQLSMSDVFPPSVTQNGEPCETDVSLEEYPEEFYNKDMQISDGSTLDCCYAVSLKDAVSPIRLTIYDNYETFTDVGTTEIAIQ
ncbi:MAG: DUF5067 domain-containing protein [Lachnospiraceae bacterium]|nr:DUF5067 domain-containing protein [Lachnospiraceae bacterium]